MTWDIRPKRRPWHARLEVLEGRLLLNAARPHAPAAEVRAEAGTTVVKAKVSGTEFLSTPYTGIPTPTFQFPATFVVQAQGQAKKFGRVQLAGHYTALVSYLNYRPGPIYPISQGLASLTDAHGDQLFMSFTGTESNRPQAHSDRSKVKDSLHGQITGGTGQFAGATGSMSATGTSKGRDGFSLNLALDVQT
jgi:hypothetical protein